MVDKLVGKSSFVGIRCAWTNAATQNCLHGLVDYAREQGCCSNVLKSRCVIICSSDSDTRTFKELGVQTVTLTMQDLSVWETFLSRANSEPLVFFLTVGKLMGEERFYRTPLDVLACLADLVHIDEASQLLNFNGKHIWRVVKPGSGKVVLTGDNFSVARILL